MIRAVVKDGTIRLLDPLPPEWREGDPLVVEAVGEVAISQDLDAWVREVKAAGASIDPRDFDRLDSALAEADRQAKDVVRSQLGLGR